MFNQIKEITLMNIRNLPSRLGSSSVIVVGIAGVVAVLTGLLSMAVGFSKALEGAGRDDRAIIMRTGATSEMNGNMTPEQRAILKAMDGIELGSAEIYAVAAIEKLGADITANVVVRGVEPTAFEIRDEVRIIEGRAFAPGRAEIIAGVKAASQFAGLNVGDLVPVRGQSWEVVGHFTAEGSALEGEIWADLDTVSAAFRRDGVSSTMRVQLSSPEDAARLTAELQNDPRFELMVQSEKEFYAGQSEDRTALINGFGVSVGIIMAIGAIFAALNTMYSAVSSRTVEIATLRALGFGSLPVVVSVLVEALTLALLGGPIDGGLVWLVFDGYTASTLNNASFSQVAFDFAVTPELLQMGLTWALLLGFIGGLFPAIRAARLPITTALRGE